MTSNLDRADYVRIKNLSVTYHPKKGSPVEAIRDFSLNIAKGEFISVVGASGCGKSTLLNVVGGLLDATGGEVLLDGTPVRGPRRDVGIVFQSPVLLPWLTVLANALLVPKIQHLDKVKYKARALELLEMVGLSGYEDKYPNELSGGMQQRVSVVRALVADPDVLLMDEPFGALDALTREQLNVDLQNIWIKTGKTIIFITHSVTEAVFLGSRVVVMGVRPGRLLDDISIDLPHPRLLSGMSSPEFGKYSDRVRDLLGVGPVSNESSTAAKHL